MESYLWVQVFSPRTAKLTDRENLWPTLPLWPPWNQPCPELDLNQQPHGLLPPHFLFTAVCAHIIVSTTPSGAISHLWASTVRIMPPFKTVLGVEREDVILKILLEVFGPLDSVLTWSKSSCILYIWSDYGVIHSRGRHLTVLSVTCIFSCSMSTLSSLDTRLQGHARLNSSLGLWCFLQARSPCVSTAAQEAVLSRIPAC